jgi:hypothetical protein
MSSPTATYFTSSDAMFYPGTAALINSLRLTGHTGEVVVYDLGLTEPQRQRLSTVATVKPPSTPHERVPKALPTSDEAAGCVAVLDSDMLVVRPLDDLIELAAQGKLVVFPDAADRWYEEWAEVFELRAPLRRERYANAGFLALSVEHWPSVLERWAEVNLRLPTVRPENLYHPLRDLDQDAMSALLMSEVPAVSVAMQPASGMAHPPDMGHIRVESQKTLQCSDPSVRLLHHSLAPKVWSPQGWRRDLRQPYVQLLPRVLCGDDVALRLTHEELPLWLRSTVRGVMASRLIRTGQAIPGAKRLGKAARSALRSTRALPGALPAG